MFLTKTRDLKTQMIFIMLCSYLLVSCNIANNSGGNDNFAPTTEWTDRPTNLPLPTLQNQSIQNVGGILISNEQEINLVKALNISDCYLPCYLGITPGETLWPLAKEFLSNIGGEYIGELHENGTGMTGHQYQTLISDSVLAEVDVNTNPRSPLDIMQLAGFLVEKDLVVQRMSVSVDTFNTNSKLQDYWVRYFPRQIFLELDEPDFIYYSPKDKDNMMIIYEAKGIVIEFRGMRNNDDKVCPDFDDPGFMSISLTLTNTESGLTILPATEMSRLTDINSWLPISEVVGIDKKEFFDQVKVDPSVCFEKINYK